MMRPSVTIALQHLAIPMLQANGWDETILWDLANEVWRALRKESWSLGVSAEVAFEGVLKRAAETMSLLPRHLGVQIGSYKLVQNSVCDAIRSWIACSELKVEHISISDCIDEIVRDLGPKPQWEQMLRAKFQEGECRV